MSTSSRADKDDPTVGQDEGFVTPLDAPLVLRVSDLLKNDYDVEQADHDGDGVIDDDLDNPNRARPSFVGVDGVYDAAALALGQRVPLGQAEIVDWNGEKFIVVRFPTGFTGNVAVEYRIADADGATDTGFAMASVADSYNGLLRGTSKADYLVGTEGADLIQAFGGNDFVLGGGGNDRIEAASGADRIDAGAGDDWIDGGDGADHITGGDGFDTVSFQSSDVGLRADLESRVGQGGYAQGDTYISVEALIGSQFADQLGGDAGDNRLEGLAGNDIIEGRGGNDVLLGGDGDDLLTGGAGADMLDGGAGNDTADYSFGATGVAISLAAGTAHGGEAEGDVLTNIENLTGTDADDVLEGDAFANILSGGRGNDILIGGAGDDTLIGGGGADTLIGGDGVDIADYTLSAEGVIVDMANGAAGGGDALGDAFSGIEIVQGSYQTTRSAGTPVTTASAAVAAPTSLTGAAASTSPITAAPMRAWGSISRPASVPPAKPSATSSPRSRCWLDRSGPTSWSAVAAMTGSRAFAATTPSPAGPAPTPLSSASTTARTSSPSRELKPIPTGWCCPRRSHPRTSR